MNRRNAIKLTAALVLLLILAALISPALAGDEIIPEAPKVAAYRPTVIPRAPEVVAVEPCEIESFDEALEAAKDEVDDELAESATSRKCRASKAIVLSITDIEGNPAGDSVPSDYDPDFMYRVGETVSVDSFDANRWNECAPGIHHFITRGEAVRYE